MATTKKSTPEASSATTKAKAAPAKPAPGKSTPKAPTAKESKPKTPAAKPAPAKPASNTKPTPTPKPEAEAKPASKTKPTSTKSAAKAKPAAAKPSAEPNAKPAAKAKPATETQTKPAAKAKPAAEPKPAPKPAAKAKLTVGPKPASKPAAEKAPESAEAKKAALRREGRESLTPEERERVKKLRATIELLKADPEWPAFLEEQKDALLKLRDHLLPNMQNTTRDHLRSGASNVSSSSGQHIGDAGSEAEVRDLTINLLNKDREQLFEIDAALERIRRGTYGICEISLDPIPKGRLRVRPFCRLTVKCQEEYEKKYGSYANYRAKNSDHVGYSGLQNDMKNAISLDDGAE